MEDLWFRATWRQRFELESARVWACVSLYSGGRFAKLLGEKGRCTSLIYFSRRCSLLP